MGKTIAQKKWRPCSQTWHKDSYIYIYIYCCWGYHQSLFFQKKKKSRPNKKKCPSRMEPQQNQTTNIGTNLVPFVFFPTKSQAKTAGASKSCTELTKACSGRIWMSSVITGGGSIRLAWKLCSTRRYVSSRCFTLYTQHVGKK